MTKSKKIKEKYGEMNIDQDKPLIPMKKENKMVDCSKNPP